MVNPVSTGNHPDWADNDGTQSLNGHALDRARLCEVPGTQPVGSTSRVGSRIFQWLYDMIPGVRKLQWKVKAAEKLS